MNALKTTILREIKVLTSRRAYIFAIFVVPMFCTLFFVSLLHEGMPVRVPTAIVDQDHSAMSRQITRSLNASQLLSITRTEEDYNSAVAAVRRGDVFGFIIIPTNFEADAVAGRTPHIDYYSNMTYFVSGTMLFKGFKLTTVTATGGMVRSQLVATGMDADAAMNLVQPMTIETHSPGNPWTNYSLYLTPSFLSTLLALMILLATAFTITEELKWGTSGEWLRKAGGSITTAVFGKLLPQTVIFTMLCWAMGVAVFSFGGFPLNGSVWPLALATILFVVANQALALAICALLPNPRLGLSICALTGILSFSLAGLSYPVEDMYGGVAILSYILPVRYFFLIYLDTGFNDLALYFTRWNFVILLVFPAVASMFMRRLKRACLRPVYVP